MDEVNMSYSHARASHQSAQAQTKQQTLIPAKPLLSENVSIGHFTIHRFAATH